MRVLRLLVRGISYSGSAKALCVEPSTVKYHVINILQKTGLKNKLLGGEGLFNTVLTGPGRIWLQTMPLPSVAAAIIPYIPTGNG